MTLDEVRAILSQHREELAALGVLPWRVFGSVARGEAGPESDADFLIELDPERRISLLDFIGIKQVMEDIPGVEVDLVEPQTLKERWRERVLGEAVSFC